MKGERAAERLRQERETFAIRKGQSIAWFVLRFATGATLLGIAVGVFAVSAHVLLAPAGYSTGAVVSSAIAMMLDLLAIGGTALIALLKPESQPGLEPVTGRKDAD